MKERPEAEVVLLDDRSPHWNAGATPILALMAVLAERAGLAAARDALRRAKPYEPHAGILESFLSAGVTSRKEELIIDERGWELGQLRAACLRLLGELVDHPVVVVSDGMERIGPTDSGLFLDWFGGERTCRGGSLTWMACADFRSIHAESELPDELADFLDAIRSSYAVIEPADGEAPPERDKRTAAAPLPGRVELEALYHLLYLKEAREAADRTYQACREERSPERRLLAYHALLVHVGASYYLGETDYAALRTDDLVEFSASMDDAALRSRALRMASLLSYSKNDYEGATRLARLAIAAAAASADEAERVMADFALFVGWESTSVTFERSGDYETLFNSLVERFASLGMKVHQAALQARTIYLMHIFRTRGAADALTLCRRGVALAKAIGDRFCLSIAYQSLGLIYQTAGDELEAQAAYHKAQRVRAEYGTVSDMARLANSLGFYHFARGAYPESLKSYQKALALLERTEEYEEICTSLVNIAYVYLYRGSYRLSTSYLEQAVRMMRRLGLADLRFHPRTYIMALLGLSCAREGKLSRAREALRMVEAAVGNDMSGRHEFYWFCRAEAERCAGKVDAAADYFERTLASCREVEPETRHTRLYCLEEYATTLLEAGRVAQASAVAQRADAEVPEDGRNAWRRARLRSLAQGIAPRPDPLPEREFDSSLILRGIAQKTAVNELQAKMLHIRFLNGLQAEVYAEKPPLEILRSAAAAIADNFPADFCAAMVIGGVEGGREPVYQRGGQGPLPPAFLDACSAGMAESGDRVARIRPREGVAGIPYHSILCLPVRPFGLAWGFVVVALGKTDSSYSRDDERILSLAAAQISIAVELRMTAARLLDAATQDTLTGVLNRREIISRIEAEIIRAKRYQRAGGRGFSILFLDMDDFKYWNDHFGHQAGDLVLRFFSSLLSSSLREADYIGRYGGDEFLVLLPETAGKDALAMAKRILAKLSSRDEFRLFVKSSGSTLIPPEEKHLPACSIGVASSDASPGIGLDELLAAADRALYRAKQGGKNQAELG